MLHRLSPSLIAVAVGGLVSCKTSSLGVGESSHVLVAGGNDIPSSQYPGVVEFRTDFSSVFQDTCTGTFIRDNVMLTAAHCVWMQRPVAPGKPTGTILGDGKYDPNEDLMDSLRNRRNPYAGEAEAIASDPGSRRVTYAAYGGRPVSSSCYMIPRGWGFESGGPGSKYDIALVFFDKKEAYPAVMDLYAGNLAKGDRITMVGFGWNKKAFGDSHKKREGTNAIAEITDDGMIYSWSPSDTAPANDAVGLREGDSGGPALKDGKVAAVASALLYSVEKSICNGSTCTKQKMDVTYHASIISSFGRSFISGVLKEYEAGKIDPTNAKGTCTPSNRSEYIQKLRRAPDGSVW